LPPASLANCFQPKSGRQWPKHRSAMGNVCSGQNGHPVENLPVKDFEHEHHLTAALSQSDTESTGTPTVELPQPAAQIVTPFDGPPEHDPPKPESPAVSEKSTPRSVEMGFFEEKPGLTVTIIGTRGLRNADWFPSAGNSGCYCVLKTFIDQQLHTTKIINDTLDPMWNEEVEVQGAHGESLEFGIWDKDLVQSKFLGRAVLEFEDFRGSGFNGELVVQNAGAGIEAYLQVKVKHAGQDYPLGLPTQLTIAIEKVPGKPLGVDLDTICDSAAYVCGINDGAVAAYNKIKGPERQVKVGDYITKVNGVEGNGTALLERMKNDTMLEVTIQRPLIFTIAISRKDTKQSLGVNLSQHAPETSLLIKEVGKGPVQEWNSTHPALAVRPGDRIVAVGGKRGSSAELVKASKISKQLQLVISRPTTPRLIGYH